MKDSFEFEDAGRKFECSAEQMRKTSPEMWWWFRVSTEAQNRYAPFRTSTDDTQASVKARVIEFYNTLLERRAAPPVNRWQRGGQRPATGEQPAQKAETPPPA